MRPIRCPVSRNPRCNRDPRVVFASSCGIRVSSATPLDSCVCLIDWSLVSPAWSLPFACVGLCHNCLGANQHESLCTGDQIPEHIVRINKLRSRCPAARSDTPSHPPTSKHAKDGGSHKRLCRLLPVSALTHRLACCIESIHPKHHSRYDLTI